MNFFDTVVTEAAKYKVMECLDSGHLSEGEMVQEFEQSIHPYAVAVNSGTSALHLALLLAGVKPGDEVILPAQTFVATGLAVLYCGAKPIFVDIGLDGNIDPQKIWDAETDKTKAVIGVAWGGNPCDVTALKRSGLKVIQDNAQAFGAYINDLPAYQYGDYTCFSFQAIKHISTGDGGMVICPDRETCERAKKLRWFGIDRKRDVADVTGERVYNLKEVGYKYHMSDYNAALGLGNLDRFHLRLARIRQIADYYFDELWPYSVAKSGGCSYWLYDLLVDRRDEFIIAMGAKGIPTSVVHVGIDRNDIFGGRRYMPVQMQWDERHVCIPIHAHLTDEDVEKVVKGVKSGW